MSHGAGRSVAVGVAIGVAVGVALVAVIAGVREATCRLDLARDGNLAVNPDIPRSGDRLADVDGLLPHCVDIDVVGDTSTDDPFVLDVDTPSSRDLRLLVGPARFLGRAGLPIPAPPRAPAGGPIGLAPSSSGSCTATECIVIAYDGRRPSPDCTELEVPAGSVPVFSCPDPELFPEPPATPFGPEEVPPAPVPPVPPGPTPTAEP